MPYGSKHALILLQRVVAAGLSDRFQLGEVCPKDRFQFVGTLGRLVAAGYIEKVIEGCGRWFYRLTVAGVASANSKQPPRLKHHTDEA